MKTQEIVKELYLLRDYLISKATLAVSLANIYESNNDEPAQRYAEGSLGSYDDAKKSVDTLIMKIEAKAMKNGR